MKDFIVLGIGATLTHKSFNSRMGASLDRAADVTNKDVNNLLLVLIISHYNVPIHTPRAHSLIFNIQWVGSITSTWLRSQPQPDIDDTDHLVSGVLHPQTLILI